MGRWELTILAALAATAACMSLPASVPAGARAGVHAGEALPWAKVRHYVEEFNRHDREVTLTAIPNAAAEAWMERSVPRFECPAPAIERAYYFRWWTYRKHLKRTPDGWVVTEFLPEVGWAGKYNTISCAAGHHLHEGRWITDPSYLDDYARFWFRGGGEPRRYSFWAADALYARYQVTGDPKPLLALLPDLIANYEAWQKDNSDSSGLFWQIDDRDGMELSIGGSGCRPTINSYQFGDARAIARIAALAGKPDIAARFNAEADRLKALVQSRLWDVNASFFKTLPQGAAQHLVDVRELAGYTPWYFNLPDPQFAVAWKQLLDPQGFAAPFGPLTAERRSPRFRFAASHECLWNGPSWPLATAITLTGLANLLNGPPQSAIGKGDYLRLLSAYAASHRLKQPDGSVVDWIDENLDRDTGAWIAHDILAAQGTHDRGKDYNHSTFCDLVISGLVGLRPRADETLEVNPLLPEGTWDFFCLTGVRYHGRTIDILYDRTGKRYGRGAGLRCFADGREVAHSPGLRRLSAPLPPRKEQRAMTGAIAGWSKYAGNPVLGGQYGTCFDISVLKEGGAYRMWVSWRPKQAVAIVESKDGIHWSAPEVVLGPRPETGWEDDINRPVVIRHSGRYEMWYTGQAKGRSAIGFATSDDGRHWERRTDSPVLAPEAAWEKVAVMCPSVLWDSKQKQYRMWYSGGEQYEPDAMGYATSPDGLHWTRLASNPIFRPDPASPWEAHKVTACQVIEEGGWHVMFYIGFRDVDHAQIGIARSRDGITRWERHPDNPIVRPVENAWDHDACYKPYALWDRSEWRLWYNGRHGSLEQIGMARHPGRDLGFPR